MKKIIISIVGIVVIFLIINNYLKESENKPVDAYIHKLIKNNQKKKLTVYIEKGREINLKGEFGNTPIHYAVKNGNYFITKLLIKNKANVLALNFHGESVIQTALMHSVDAYSNTLNNKKLIDLLVKNGAVIDDLHSAVILGDTTIVDSILKSKKYDLNKKDSLGYSPLLHASILGYVDIVEMLLKSGADVNSHWAHTQRTPLHFTASLDVVRILAENNADLNYGCDQDGPPLQYAAVRNRIDIVKYLINKKALIDCKDRDGDTTLHFIASLRKKSKHEETKRILIIKLLIDSGANVNSINNDGYTVLDDAISDEVDSILVKNGAKLKKVYKAL